MDASELIIAFLNKTKISYQCLRHKPIYTLEDGLEISRATGIEPSKCLLLVNRRNQSFMVLAGEEQIDLRLIADTIHSSRLSFAPPETLMSLLHTTPGAVSPLGLVFDTEVSVKLIIDESLLKCDELLLAPCVNDLSIIIKTQDFMKVFLPACGHPDYLILNSRRLKSF